MAKDSYMIGLLDLGRTIRRSMEAMLRPARRKAYKPESD
jgi:hypothetical protein